MCGTPGGWDSIGSRTTSPRSWNQYFCISHHHHFESELPRETLTYDCFRSLGTLCFPPRFSTYLSVYHICGKAPGSPLPLVLALECSPSTHSHGSLPYLSLLPCHLLIFKITPFPVLPLFLLHLLMIIYNTLLH